MQVVDNVFSVNILQEISSLGFDNLFITRA